jgi:uncharacterized membrane protein YccC
MVVAPATNLDPVQTTAVSCTFLRDEESASAAQGPAMGVGAAVGVGVGVATVLGVAVGVGVPVGFGVGVATGLDVAVGAGVAVAVGVTVAVGDAELLAHPAIRTASPTATNPNPRLATDRRPRVRSLPMSPPRPWTRAAPTEVPPESAPISD